MVFDYDDLGRLGKALRPASKFQFRPISNFGAQYPILNICESCPSQMAREPLIRGTLAAALI
jgi:hypothetical protein